ncbi:peptidoglycan/LPS O-acetylase OafA/YrhL [Novosphingobium fluoreni]|uniref:Peptidoglycan/LPS O-acetylase OafA/YrhL n=1 Tax=Novosphingobium fluoreni TaxID=1391222 RepID=A0A7W6BVU8_9SPHN|nr:peptidoglycan/LPS O-acetylase OafA/YrhL [Novosphingobium fluoreni]
MINTRSSSPPASERFIVLDGMRGVAALAVVFLHIYRIAGEEWKPGLGYLAVDLFFLLSGFVLAHAYDDRLSCGLSASEFIRQRLVRMYPLYAVGLIFGLLAIAGAATIGKPYVPFFRLLVSLLFNIFFLPIPSRGMDGHAFIINFPSWSLFFEIIANALFGLFWIRLSGVVLILITALSFFTLTLVVICFGTMDLGAMGNDLAGGLPRVGFGFFGGVMLYRLRALWRWRVSWVWPVALLAAILISRPSEPLLPFVQLGVVGLLFPMLILAGARARIGGHFAAAAEWLGAISFPIYVIHAPMRIIATALLDRLDVPPGTYPTVIFLATALLLSALLHRFIDPMLRQALQGPSKALLAAMSAKFKGCLK